MYFFVCLKPVKITFVYFFIGSSIYRGENNPVALPLGSSLTANSHGMLGRTVQLIMQQDGKLVVKSTLSTLPPIERIVWSTNTRNIKDGLIFKSDGNLVLNDKDGNQVWESGTSGTDVERFTIEWENSNFVGYSKDGAVVWKSNPNTTPEEGK